MHTLEGGGQGQRLTKLFRHSLIGRSCINSLLYIQPTGLIELLIKNNTFNLT